MKLARQSKYRNRRSVDADGTRWDSQREKARWGELLLLQRAGEITDLDRQVKFPLSVCGVRIGHIVVDFTYRRGGELVAEDVKQPATETRLFKWKAKHLRAEHGLSVEVVR